MSDSAVLDPVESLRLHSVGAGPLEPAPEKSLRVTDVLAGLCRRAG